MRNKYLTCCGLRLEVRMLKTCVVLQIPWGVGHFGLLSGGITLLGAGQEHLFAAQRSIRAMKPDSPELEATRRRRKVMRFHAHSPTIRKNPSSLWMDHSEVKGLTFVLLLQRLLGQSHAYLRWWRVLRSILRCFFLLIRLRRFLMTDPIPGLRSSDSQESTFHILLRFCDTTHKTRENGGFWRLNSSYSLADPSSEDFFHAA